MLYFFLKNPFLSSKISVSNFDKLVRSHLASLEVANKDSSFTTILNDTKALYQAFSHRIAEKSTSSSSKKGYTENVDNVVELVKNFIAELEPNIQYQFRKEPGKYAEFYPNGITEYRRAGKDELLVLFKRLIDTCFLYAERLGKDVLSEAHHLQERLEHARNGQVHKKQTVKDLSGSAAASQQALAIRLYSTLGFLISTYAGQPDMINKFFDFSFLPKHTVKKAELASETLKG